MMGTANVTSRNLWLSLPWLPLPATSSSNMNKEEKAAELFLQQRQKFDQGNGGRACKAVGAELSVL